MPISKALGYKFSLTNGFCWLFVIERCEVRAGIRLGKGAADGNALKCSAELWTTQIPNPSVAVNAKHPYSLRTRINIL